MRTNRRGPSKILWLNSHWSGHRLVYKFTAGRSCSTFFRRPRMTFFHLWRWLGCNQPETLHISSCVQSNALGVLVWFGKPIASSGRAFGFFSQVFARMSCEQSLVEIAQKANVVPSPGCGIALVRNTYSLKGANCALGGVPMFTTQYSSAWARAR